MKKRILLGLIPAVAIPVAAFAALYIYRRLKHQKEEGPEENAPEGDAEADASELFAWEPLPDEALVEAAPEEVPAEAAEPAEPAESDGPAAPAWGDGWPNFEPVIGRAAGETAPEDEASAEA